MIGDGINDSPALSQSFVGISISNAANIAVDSSDVTWVQIRFKNINDPNADTFWLSTSSFDSEGAFTMNRSLDNDNGGTLISDYIQASVIRWCA